MVPTYANDDPDWDQDNWIPFSTPSIPSFLILAAIVFVISLVTAVVIFRKFKRDKNPYYSLSEDKDDVSKRTNQ
jgi:hypothetical protein